MLAQPLQPPSGTQPHWRLPRLPYKAATALARHPLVVWYLAFSGAHEALLSSWVCPGCTHEPTGSQPSPPLPMLPQFLKLRVWSLVPCLGGVADFLPCIPGCCVYISPGVREGRGPMQTVGLQVLCVLEGVNHRTGSLRPPTGSQNKELKDRKVRPRMGKGIYQVQPGDLIHPQVGEWAGHPTGYEDPLTDHRLWLSSGWVCSSAAQGLG